MSVSSGPGSNEQWVAYDASSGGVGTYLTPEVHGLKPVDGRLGVLRVLLGLSLALAALSIVVNSVLYQRLNGPRAFDESTDTLLLAAGLASFLGAILLLCTGIATMMTFKRMLENGRILAPDSGKHAPHWAITGWFVPFLNLVRPKRVVDQAWVTSRPANERTPPGYEVPSSTLWWGAFLIWSFASRAAPTAPISNYTIEELASESLGTAIVDGLFIVAGFLYFRLLSEVGGRHQAALRNPWVNPRRASASPFLAEPSVQPPPPDGGPTPPPGNGFPQPS